MISIWKSQRRKIHKELFVLRRPPCRAIAVTRHLIKGRLKKTSLLRWHKKRAASNLDSALQTILLEPIDFKIPRLCSVRLSRPPGWLGGASTEAVRYRYALPDSTYQGSCSLSVSDPILCWKGHPKCRCSRVVSPQFGFGKSVRKDARTSEKPFF